MVKVQKIVAMLILCSAFFGTTGGAYADSAQARPTTGSVEAVEMVETVIPEISCKEPLVVNEGEIIKANVASADVAEDKVAFVPVAVTVEPEVTPSKVNQEIVEVPPQESAPTLPQVAPEEPVYDHIEPWLEGPEDSIPTPVYDHIEPWLEDPEDSIPTPVYDHIEPWLGDPEPPVDYVQPWPEDEVKYLTAEEFAIELYGTNVLAYVERDYKHTPNNDMKHAGMTLYSDTGSGLPVDIEFLDIANDMPLGCYELVSSKTSECYGDYASNIAYFCDARSGQMFTVTSMEKGILFETEADGECSAYFADVVPCGTYEVSEVYTCTSEYISEIGPAICAYAISENYDIRILNLLHMYWSSDFCVAVK